MDLIGGPVDYVPIMCCKVPCNQEPPCFRCQPENPKFRDQEVSDKNKLVIEQDWNCLQIVTPNECGKNKTRTKEKTPNSKGWGNHHKRTAKQVIAENGP